MALRPAPFWHHVAGRNEKPALFAATIIVAAKLKDAAIAATLLQPFGLTARAGKWAKTWPLLHAQTGNKAR